LEGKNIANVVSAPILWFCKRSNDMVDIHSHILPGIDDGAWNVDYALRMARVAVADGTTHMIATPHHYYDYRLPQTELFERVTALQTELSVADIPLTILPGYEVRLYEGTIEDWQNQCAGPLAQSRYVLAEPPFNRYDDLINRLLFTLFDWGYVPILAHPERIMPLQKDLSLLEPFLQRGGLIQLTADSLTTSPTSTDRITAETMLREGMVDFLASDAHDLSYRVPGLTAGYKVAAKIIGLEKATALVTTSPMAVIQDHDIVSSQ